jgi:hypothetical protein
MSDYTPGPWYVQPSDNPFFGLLIKPIPGQVVAQTDPTWNQADNARLIAAAPELVEALQWALAQIEDDPDPDHRQAFDAARAVLAKATGEA